MTKSTSAKIILVSLLILTTLPALASAKPLIPSCDPTVLPKDGTTTIAANGDVSGPCGLDAFVLLLKNIIEYASLIIIPIAFCVIGYAGFIILTSGGNTEKVSEARGMIKIAITGVIILLTSYILIQFIFNALRVADTIGGAPSGVN